MRQILTILTGLSLHFAWFGQNVEVEVIVQKAPPFITSLTKHEFETRLVDSVIDFSNKRVAIFTDSIHFIGKNGGLRVDYKLDLKVVDTTIINAAGYKVPMVIVHSRLYENNSLPDSVPGWMATSGASYGFQINATDISEHDALTKCMGIARVAAHSMLLNYLPLSLTNAFPAKNVASHLLLLFMYHREIQISINQPQPSNEVTRIITLIRNIFVQRQQFYYHARFQKAYFNYYFTSDSVSEESRLTEALKISIDIACTNSGYNLTIDAKDPSIKINLEKRTLFIDSELLRHRPSAINGQISSMIESFLFDNL